MRRTLLKNEGGVGGVALNEFQLHPDERGTGSIRSYSYGGHEINYSLKRREFPVTLQNAGYTLQILYDLDFLDTKVTSADCPAGCIMIGMHGYGAMLRQKLGGYVDALWYTENDTALRFNVKKKPVGPGIWELTSVGDTLDNERLVSGLVRAANVLWKSKATENHSGIFTAFAEIHIIDDGAHANLLLLTFRFARENEASVANVQVDIYDPWGDRGESKRYGYVPDMQDIIIRFVRSAMERERIENRGIYELSLPDRKGIQHFESKLPVDRWRAPGEDGGKYIDGYCASFCHIMMILRMLQPHIPFASFEHDLAFIFMESDSGKQESMAMEVTGRPAVASMLGVVARGTRALAKVFSMCYWREASRFHADTYCCKSEDL